jgi:uncharacterized Zn finger protein
MSTGKVKLNELLKNAKNMKCFHCGSSDMEEPNWDGSNSVAAKCKGCGEVTALVTTGRVVDDILEK